MAGFAVVVALCAFLFWKLPGSFVPEEDQGYALTVVQLPAGATIARTNKAMDQIVSIIRGNDEVVGTFALSGFSFIGSGENVGMVFTRFKPWGERKASAPQIIQRINGQLFGGVKDAMAFVVNLPTIRGLGRFGGFDMYLQDRAGQGHDALVAAQNVLLGKAAQHADTLVGVRPNGLEDAPQLDMKVDRVQAQSMGLSLNDVYSAIQLMLAPVYVDDFIYNGRVLRVNMEADAPYRANVDALGHFYVPSTLAAGTNAGDAKTSASASGTMPMIPLSNVVQTNWIMASPSLVRYNGYEAIDIVGGNTPAKSTGEAMTLMDSLVKELPPGFGAEWTGQSLQEIIAGNQAPILIALSIIVVFLCLAALYESWSVPVAVLLVVPLGMTGMLIATWLRGLQNDVYFKVGLLTIIGLAAKNAILIVEFAVAEQRAGRSLGAAIVDAGRLRLRPILMTSFCFILGVSPLALSTGAGANARHAIGTGVIGGMLFASLLGVLLIPIFYVFVRRLLGDRLESEQATFDATKDPTVHG
jgi:multidrug efflux pump